MKTIIRAGVILLALAPAAVVAVVLAAYLNKTRIEDLEHSLERRGQAIARHLAVASASGLPSGDLRLLDRLARAALEEAEVRSVLIQDTAGRILVSRHRPERTSDPVSAHFPTWFDAPVYEIEAELDAAVSERFHEPVSTAVVGRVSVELSRKGLLYRHQQVIQTTVLIAALGLVLASGFGWRMGRKVVEPMQRLEQALWRLRDGLAERPSWHSPVAELGNLARDVNTAASVLKTSHRHLQRLVAEATAELRRELEALKSENAELDLGRRRAVQASQAKSEFLANMSHEIRTPLNGVLGFIELLSRTELNHTQQGYLQTLRASAENLLDILNDVLDFSKIEAGKFKIRCRPFDLREVLENAVLLFAANARQKGLRLLLDVEPDVPSRLLGDAPRIAQIITNFVSNAVKFTEQGEVEVRVGKTLETSRAVTLDLQIRDTGIGIAPADRERLFGAFEQFDALAGAAGTGLGLAISRRLVAMMDGQIRVDSRPGAGSVFSVSLVVDKQPEAMPKRIGPRLPVLLVSSDPLLGRVVGHILVFGGAEPVVVADSTAAAQRLAAFRPIAVIIDVEAAASSCEALLDVLAAQSGVVVLLGADEPHSAAALYRERLPALRLAAKPPTSGELLPLLGLAPLPARPVDGAVRRPERDARYAKPVAVLLADDNAINRQLACIFLSQLGVQVDEARTGAEVLDRCHRRRYDLILMDIHMPDVDGLEAARSLRALADNPNSHVPVVALTADAMNRERAHYLEAGMNDHLAKPITEAALQRVLETWCPTYFAPAAERPSSSGSEA